jgi:predicted dehydrogenase
MYSAQLAEFVEAVAAGRQPRPSGEDGRVVVQVVEQAYASAGDFRRRRASRAV